MALLDDAIREHLELKRSSGADPGDVARLEDEAFGDGDKHPAPPQDSSSDAQADEAEAALAEPEAPAKSEAAEEPDAEPAVEREEPDARADATDSPDEAAAPPDDGSEDNQSTRQFTAVELDDAQRPGAPERAQPPPSEDQEVHDELEDTPDFLQETPEHDRLWFEQKPPRDFDF